MIRISRRLSIAFGLALALVSMTEADSPSEGPARLVHDFFPGEVAGNDGVGQLTRIGDVLYFAADDLDTGRNVWRSDGTAAGTQRVSFSEEPAFSHSVIVGRVGPHVLWRTSAASGSWLVSAGRRGDGVTLRTYPPNPDIRIDQSSILGGHLYFQECTSEECTTLWTDGTHAGTGPVPALALFTSLDQQIFGTLAGRWLVFHSGRAFYAYDVPRGKVRLLLPTGAPGSFIKIYPVGDTLFILTAHDRVSLWASRLNAPRASHLFTNDLITIAGWDEDKLYFATKNGRLWSTDGSRQGTRPYSGLRVEPYRVLANRLGTLGPLTFLPIPGYYRAGLLAIERNSQELRTIQSFCQAKNACRANMSPVTIAGDLAFLEINSTLWRSDGTPKGTKPLEILAGVDPYTFRSVDGRLVLSAARDGERRLWETDGTVSGTRALTDSDPERPFWAQGPPTPFAGALYVPAARNPMGPQLWRVADGRATPVTELRHLARGLEPHLAVPVGDRVILRSHYTGGWVSLAEDGSTEKLPVYEDECSDPWDDPCSLKRILLGRRLLFTEDSLLTSTDGTAAGTIDLLPSPAAMARWGDRALVLDGRSGLWTSDGSAEGTRLFARLPPNPGSYWPGYALASGPLAFLFRGVPVDDELAALELWRTDGTQAGTLRLISLSFAKNLTPAPNPTLLGGRLFFQFQGKLWMSDGSVEGTRPIPNPLPGAILALATGTSTLYAATDRTDEEPQTLWAIDSVTLQQRRLGTFYHVSGGYEGTSLGSLLENTFFFRVGDERSSFRWWLTEGTPESTHPLPEPLASSTARTEKFFTAGDRRYFKACDPEHGCELWSTDRLGEDTRLVQDLWPGPRGSDPEILAVTEDALWIAATHPDVGRELWKIDLREIAEGLGH